MSDDDEEDFQATKKALGKMKGTAFGEDDDDDDDESDEDYEAAGGDMNLYDSTLDEKDELLFMRETMQILMGN